VQASADKIKPYIFSSFNNKPSSTFQLVVASVDWISKGISSLYQIKANVNLQTTNNFWQGSPSHFNVGCLHKLIVGPTWNPTFKGAQTANKSLTHIVEYSKLMMNVLCPELIVECSYIASSFQYFSSYNLRLVVEFTLILHSERECNASIIVEYKVALPQPHDLIVILTLKRAVPNHSHQLIVGYKCSNIFLNFCKDCRIFCEGVK
jgi:hypothetical protein